VCQPDPGILPGDPVPAESLFWLCVILLVFSVAGGCKC
jgi:hypothetical protein